MATLLDLERRGDLVRLDPDLEPDELEERCIYVLPRVIGQIDALEGVESPTGCELSPAEQLYEFLAYYASGGELEMPTQFHDMWHREGGIWELKTRDLRLFGWFYRRDCFICTDVKDATFVKQGPPSSVGIHGSLYHGFANMVVMGRDNLDLDPPKHIDGTHPENVVSNYTTR